jgi:hypothetical protein
MYRAKRIEMLEKRKMFSVTDLILDPFNAATEAATAADESPAVVFNKYYDAESPSILGKMHLEDISLGFTQGRDVNTLGWSWGVTQTATLFAGGADSGAPLAVIAGGQEGEEVVLGAESVLPMDVFSLNLSRKTEHTIGPQAGDATVVQGVILPYVEQDNLYKTYIVTNNHDPDSMLTDISDGTSNTMMVATKAGGEVVSNLLVHEPDGTQEIIAVLIGLAAEPSGSYGSEVSSRAAAIDIWEHASMDQSLVATTFGRGSAASQITHDMEFEKWAEASQFERAQTSSTFYDLLISSYLERTPGNHANSILHEDNEFYFPRM